MIILLITLCFFSRVCAFISFFIHSTPFFFELSKRISPHYKKAEEKKNFVEPPLLRERAHA